MTGIRAVKAFRKEKRNEAEFSGLVDRSTLTLKTYAELFRPQNLDIIIRTVTMAGAVTIAAALILTRAVEVPSIPTSGDWSGDTAALRLRDLTDYRSRPAWS